MAGDSSNCPAHAIDQHIRWLDMRLRLLRVSHANGEGWVQTQVVRARPGRSPYDGSLKNGLRPAAPHTSGHQSAPSAGLLPDSLSPLCHSALRALSAFASWRPTPFGRTPRLGQVVGKTFCRLLAGDSKLGTRPPGGKPLSRIILIDYARDVRNEASWGKGGSRGAFQRLRDSTSFSRRRAAHRVHMPSVGPER